MTADAFPNHAAGLGLLKLRQKSLHTKDQTA
jgi:hypothetical protein